MRSFCVLRGFQEFFEELLRFLVLVILGQLSGLGVNRVEIIALSG